MVLLSMVISFPFFLLMAYHAPHHQVKRNLGERRTTSNLGGIRVVVRMKANYGIVLLDPEGVFEHEEGL